MKTYSHPTVYEVPLEQIMHALSDPCRLSIVRRLGIANGGELACNEFDLNVSKATVSHHFDVLREAGLVQSRLEGTKCLTSLRAGELEEHFPGLLQLILGTHRFSSSSTGTAHILTEK
jgi:DNA-binding transcriptional ArsR family regulator